ncbi:MAG: pilus assembly protein TadG-related protein [Pseudomonadota bacterium]
MAVELPRKMGVVQNESGSLTVFAVVTFMIMIMFAGFAIDVARIELERSKTQLALDNAVLAGASLKGNKKPDGSLYSPIEVVELYLAKSDIPQSFKDSVAFKSELDQFAGNQSGRAITISGNASVSTIFMDFLGVETLTTPVKAAALEVIERDVEVSLALDISASMGNTRKIGAMTEAAKGFIETILAANSSDAPATASISLIQYGGYVNAGKDLTALINGAYPNPEININPQLLNYLPLNGSCGNFTAAAFDDTALWDSAEYRLVLPATNWETGFQNKWPANSGKPLRLSLCGNDTKSELLPVSSDKEELLRRLTEPRTYFNTSIDYGVRWGVALLDPSMQPIIAGLTDNSLAFVPGFPTNRLSTVMVDVVDEDNNIIGEEQDTRVTSTQAVNPAFANRPLPYGSETTKILVVMSDGANYDPFVTKPEFGDGNSSALSDWAKTPASNNNYFYYSPVNDEIKLKGSNWQQNGFIKLRWDELFALRSDDEVRAFYDGPGDKKFWKTDHKGRKRAGFMRREVNSRTKDARMHNLCSLARERGITIYTIAYEASEADYERLKACATPGFDYVASSDTIDAVFSAIASSVTKLRLTQ